jgi:uncharacterized membrane protein YkoI
MRFKLLACGLFLVSAVGCSKALFDNKTEPIALDQIPASIMEVAQKELPGVKFEYAWKFQEQGEDVYEIKGKTAAGKICEVEVSASGKVLEVE